MRIWLLLLGLGCAPALPAPLANDWLTFSKDLQRTAWARDETALSRENVASLTLLWKAHLDAAPKQMTGPTVPVVITHVQAMSKYRDLVLVASASDDAFVLDAATGERLWNRHFQMHARPRQPPSWNCPGALNATPVLDVQTDTAYLVTSDGTLYALDIRNGEDRRAPRSFVPPFSKNWTLTLAGGLLYTTLSQNCNGASSGVYAIDPQDSASSVHSFQASPAGAGIWGRAGAAIDHSGRLIVATGDGPFAPDLGKYGSSILALDPKTLQVADSYTPANFTELYRKDLDLGNTSSTVFPFQGRELIAAAAKEGIIYLLDTKSLGGPDHHTPLFRSDRYLNSEAKLQLHGFWGAISTWVDGDGTRWLLVPAWGPPTDAAKTSLSYGPVIHGGIMAFRICQPKGVPQTVPVWISKDMAYPEPVAIANGLVFALANGANEILDDLTSGRMLTGAERVASPSGHAILSVLDAKTGKELYSSGNLIAGWTHFGGLALSRGRIFLTTHDGTVYAFGLKP